MPTRPDGRRPPGARQWAYPHAIPADGPFGTRRSFGADGPAASDATVSRWRGNACHVRGQLEVLCGSGLIVSLAHVIELLTWAGHASIRSSEISASTRDWVPPT